MNKKLLIEKIKSAIRTNILTLLESEENIKIRKSYFEFMEECLSR